MTKSEFCNTLRERLKGLPPEDIERSAEFYSEIIEDKTESGIPEKEAVAQIGSIDSIVADILSEIPIKKLIKEKYSFAEKHKTLGIVLIIAGFPLWFPILIALLTVIAAIYISIWTVVVSVFAVSVALFFSALALLPFCVYLIIKAHPLTALASAGVSFICMGLSIPIFILGIICAKYTLLLGKKIITGIKKCFIGKEKKA